MEENSLEQEKKNFTPEKGFSLVGIDYFDNPDGQLYLIENFEMYQDALNAKSIITLFFYTNHFIIM